MRNQYRWKQARDGMINLIYPPRCPFREGVLADGDIGVCKRCLSRLPYVKDCHCMKCGKPILVDKEYCEDCVRNPKDFKVNYPLLVYKDEVQESLVRFKYHNRREYADAYARLIYNRYQKEIKREGIEGIIPVPIHNKKYKKRRYNQAGLLAASLSNYSGIPVVKDMVLRVSDTPPQKELSEKQRFHNMSQAFYVDKRIHTYQNILLVDDIYTTGATVQAITKLALDVGVKNVVVLTVAIGVGY